MTGTDHLAIGRETLIDNVATILAIEELLTTFNGRQDTPTSGALTRVAQSLLASVVPDSDGLRGMDMFDACDPVAVETFARSKEKLEAWLDAYGHERAKLLDGAKWIRQTGDAFGDMTEAFEGGKAQ